MKKLYISFIIAIFMTTAQAAVTIKHTAKVGETLSGIAFKNHTTIAEIRKRSGLGKDEKLKLGTVLTVAMNTVNPDENSYSPLSKQKVKTIKRKSFHTLGTARIARAKNNKPKVVVQKKKKKIRITSKKSKIHKKKKSVQQTKRKNTKTYTVQNGDTLFSIAQKHSMTVSELLKANDVKYQETLKLGQTFKVAKLVRKVAKKKKVVKRVKKDIKKKKKAVKVVKKDIKKNKKLHTALTRTVRKQRIKKRNRVTVDDIFFKSSQPNILLFSSNKNSKKVTNIINVAKTKLGRKYVWGAVGQRGTFDCSGFTSYVFRKNGINIPRTSLNQSKYGKYVSRANLKKGDLIFFDTSKRRKGYVNHVGIYLGNGQFIHASSAKKKVVVSNLSKFYSQRYKGARRPS